MNFKFKDWEFTLWDSDYANDLLFVAVSGADEYGWATPKSDLDIRLVWIPDIRQALSITSKGKNHQHQIDTERGIIDLSTYPMQNYLKLLCKGNGNTLENLFQKHLFSGQEMVKDIQQIVMGNLHIAFLFGLLWFPKERHG